MRKNITSIVYITVSLLMISCVYNNEEELYPVEMCDTTNITYHETIVPILSQRCYECHGNNQPVSGFSLEGYSNIKAKIDEGRLIGAIRHMTGFSPMPKDRPSLPECDILKIEKWVSDGAPEN